MSCEAWITFFDISMSQNNERLKISKKIMVAIPAPVLVWRSESEPSSHLEKIDFKTYKLFNQKWNDQLNVFRILNKSNHYIYLSRKVLFFINFVEIQNWNFVFQRSCDVDVVHDLAYKALRQVIASWGLFRRWKRHCHIVYALTNRFPGTIST